MKWYEIILLLGGVLTFIVSFFLPEKKEGSVSTAESEEQIKEIAKKEVLNAQEQIRDTVDETLQYSVEKTERALDRLTNEKIMAVNEYSDTVLAEIKKNYDETVFLYSMLNDKHTNIKNTAITVEQAAREAEKTAKTAEKVAKAAEETVKTVEKSTIISKMSDEMQEYNAITDKTSREEQMIVKETNEPVWESEKLEKIEILPVNEFGQNNNERILVMHKEGKSNMAIAKELGLGIGEVKLVIDLFRQA